MAAQVLQTTCCVVGGGPAGMMLGYLLARARVPVIIIEKHKDFFRDFRGDTVHPSTLELMYELGLLDELLKLPHQQMETVGIMFGDQAFEVADFRHLPTRCKFIALMPQWDLLNFIAHRAREFPDFDLRMEHAAVGLVGASGQITGVEADTPAGRIQINADLVVACDGRHSTMRQAARLEVLERGAPIDALWFRLSRNASDSEQALGNINYGKALVLINRSDYFQAGLIIAKGSFEQIKSEGIEGFRRSVLHAAPFLGGRVEELRDWQQIQLLSIQINRLRRWHRPGLLCIGDAAHAMSPAGGVGINLAVQDAVATANLLADVLRQRRVTEASLARVQQRREFPARLTQEIQVLAHKGLTSIFLNPGRLEAPWPFKAVMRIPGIHRLLGRAVGMGARPEHVRGAADVTDKIYRKRLVLCAGALATTCALGALCIFISKRR